MLLRKRTRIAAGLHMGHFIAGAMNTALLEDTYLAFTTGRRAQPERRLVKAVYCAYITVEV